jgi:hypothetical protein
MEESALWAGNGAGGTMKYPETTISKKKRPPQNLNSCNMCVRYILIVTNCIFFFLGCTVIGLGIYVVVDKVNFVTALFGTTLVAPASYMIIAAGCIVFVISFVGCFGALFESRMLLIIYSSALGLVFLLSVVGFVLAIVFRSDVTDQIREYMRRTLQMDYGVNLENDWNQWVTMSWNEAQKKWYCCAVEDQSWGVYRQSQWYSIQSGVPDMTRPYVPESCCKRDQYNKYIDQQKCQTWTLGPPGKQSGQENEASFYRGCYEVGKSVIYEISGYLIGTGIAMIILVLGTLALSIQLTRKV